LKRFVRPILHILLLIASSLCLVNIIITIQEIKSGQVSQNVSTSLLQSRMGTKFPIESFVMLETEVTYYRTACDEQGTRCINDGIPVSVTRGSASGVIVGECGNDCSLVLTAAHVCSSSGPGAPLPLENVSVDYQIDLTTGFGRSTVGTVIATDEDNDLCMLITQSYIGPPLQISSDNLIMHQDVYNMASPLGLAVPFAVPVFSGYYAGEVDGLAIFTFPVAPGSSGSPIMNDDGEILGLISGAAINFDEFAIGSKTQAVRSFVLAVEVSLAGY